MGSAIRESSRCVVSFRPLRLLFGDTWSYGTSSCTVRAAMAFTHVVPLQSQREHSDTPNNLHPILHAMPAVLGIAYFTSSPIQATLSY